MNTILIVLFCTITSATFAQLGGKKSFEFLNVPDNARLGGLGGINVSLKDTDVNFAFSNPTLISDTLAEFASVHYKFYIADVGYATAAYVHDFKKIGAIAIGVQHFRYGEIKSYDASGADIGNYNAGETLFLVSKSHSISNFRFGVTLKFALSSIAGYRANALMVDIGGLFVHPNKDLTVGLTIKNMGTVLSDYSEHSESQLPFDVRLGATLKPEHMPLRFSLTAYNLTSSYGTYYPTGGSEPGGLKKILRHVNFGTEVLLHRNVNLLVGYNYLIHDELKLENGGGFAGISLGFSAKIRSFELVFSRSAYVVGNAGYAFTLSKNLKTILSRG